MDTGIGVIERLATEVNAEVERGTVVLDGETGEEVEVDDEDWNADADDVVSLPVRPPVIPVAAIRASASDG